MCDYTSENKMAVKLSQSVLPELLSWLKQHLPHTFKVYGDLKSHLRGQLPDVNYFVDRWPHPQAVVARLDLAGEQLAWKNYQRNVLQGAFGTNDDALKTLLRDPSVVDWNIITLFSCMSDTLYPVVRSVAEETGRSFSFKENTLLKATSQDLQPVAVPEGLKFQPVSSAEIRIIDTTWKFASEGSEPYVQQFVEHFPSVFLVTESGQHVGHMISTSYGTMGMLYVNPDFRRKGYAKAIISLLAQKHFDQGEDVYVLVEDDNPISLSLHLSLGFRVVTDCKFAWLNCHSKNSGPQPKATCCV